MDKTIYSKKIAESLSSGNHPKEFATLFVALLRQLAMGGPVSREKLAGALGWSGARVATVLEQAPGTEYDDEANIIGLGLTLRETSHVFEVDGRHLYTWCALDTLMFPALTGKIARVTSRCAATRACGRAATGGRTSSDAPGGCRGEGCQPLRAGARTREHASGHRSDRQSPGDRPRLPAAYQGQAQALATPIAC